MTETTSETWFDAWLDWLRDFSEAARRFTEEEAIPVESDDERELLALKLALYARALTLFNGSVLLVEHDRQLDFRFLVRGVIESAIYLIALDSDPSLVQRMKDDDYKSRHSRADLHLKATDLRVSDGTRQLLEEFVARGAQGAKPVHLSGLLEGNQFERLYRSFRDISGDAAHVSVTALSRHYIEDLKKQSARLIVDPALDKIEMKMTAADLAISMIIVTMLIMKVKQKTMLWDEFAGLLQRYKHLAATNEQNA